MHARLELRQPENISATKVPPLYVARVRTPLPSSLSQQPGMLWRDQNTVIKPPVPSPRVSSRGVSPSLLFVVETTPRETKNGRDVFRSHEKKKTRYFFTASSRDGTPAPPWLFLAGGFRHRGRRFCPSRVYSANTYGLLQGGNPSGPPGGSPCLEETTGRVSFNFASIYQYEYY